MPPLPSLPPLPTASLPSPNPSPSSPSPYPPPPSAPPPFAPQAFTLTVSVQLPTTQNLTSDQIAASFAGLEVGTANVKVEVTQTWSLTLSWTSAANATMLVAEVLEACEAALPGCSVSLASSAAHRALVATAGGSHHHMARELSSQVDVQVVRPVTGSTSMMAAVPLPSSVSTTSSSLDGVGARWTAVCSGGAAEANELLDGSLAEGRVRATLSAGLGLDKTALSVDVQQPIFPPMPPPSPTSTSPPCPTPSQLSSLPPPAWPPPPAPPNTQLAPLPVPPPSTAMPPAPSSALPAAPSIEESRSADVETSGEEGLSGGAVASIVVGASAICLFTAMGTAWRRRRVKGGGSRAVAATSMPFFVQTDDHSKRDEKQLHV